MMRPDVKVENVYLYPKTVDFQKPIDGLAALVEHLITDDYAGYNALGAQSGVERLGCWA
ncbi:hypothetical protein ABH908_001977 [Pseudomonas frederiksbergensis]